jgi:hypothetical protein
MMTLSQCNGIFGHSIVLADLGHLSSPMKYLSNDHVGHEISKLLKGSMHKRPRLNLKQ